MKRLIGVSYEVLIESGFIWRKKSMTLWDDVLANLVYIEAAVLVVVAVILERFIARYLKRVSKRKEWPPHVTNGLVLIFRLLIILGAVATVMRIGGVPQDWLVAYSALGGAAIGFASQQTLGNFMAGLFIFITHPFRVNDYVRVDTLRELLMRSRSITRRF